MTFPNSWQPKSQNSTYLCNTETEI